jgi:hypothetical protein
LTVPKLRLLAAAFRRKLTPVPASVIEAGEFTALLVTVRLPLMAVPVVGAKATLKVVLAPAAKLYGRAGPVTLKPAPVTVVWVIFTLPVPAFVSVTV